LRLVAVIEQRLNQIVDRIGSGLLYAKDDTPEQKNKKIFDFIT